MLEVSLTDSPVPVPNAAGLFAMNIDPEAAAESYRTRTLEQLGPAVTAEEKSTDASNCPALGPTRWATS